MAYNDRITCTFCAYNGDEYTFKVKKQGTNHNNVTVRGASDPVEVDFSTGSSYADLKVIAGQKLTFTFIAQEYLQFKDLYSTNPLEFIGVLEGPSGVEWQGFLIPEQYQSSWGGNKLMSFSFNCGLALLKDKYIKDLGIGTYDEISLFELLYRSLQLLGSYTSLSVSSNIKTGTDSDNEFLVKKYTTPEQYKKTSLYDMLEDILKGHRLTQGAGEWECISYANLMLDSYYKRTHTSLTPSTVEVLVDQTGNLIGTTEKRLEAFPHMSYTPHVSDVSIKAKTEPANAVKNAEFDSDTGSVTNMENWTHYLPAGSSDGYMTQEQGNNVIAMRPVGKDDASHLDGSSVYPHIRQTIRAKMGRLSPQKFMLLTFEYALFVKDTSSYTQDDFRIGIELKHVNGWVYFKSMSGQSSPELLIDILTLQSTNKIMNINTSFDGSGNFVLNSPTIEAPAEDEEEPTYNSVSIPIICNSSRLPSSSNAVLEFELKMLTACGENYSHLISVVEYRIKNIKLHYTDKAEKVLEYLDPEPLDASGSNYIKEVPFGVHSISSDNALNDMAFLNLLFDYDSTTRKRTLPASWTVGGAEALAKTFDSWQECIADTFKVLFMDKVEKVSLNIRNNKEYLRRQTHADNLTHYLTAGCTWNVRRCTTESTLVALYSYAHAAGDSLLINDTDKQLVNDASTQAINNGKQ